MLALPIELWRIGANLQRRMFRRRVDYVRLTISGAMPELPADLPFWQRLMTRTTPPALQTLRRQLHQIQADRRTTGVLLIIDGPQVGWATLQSLLNELERFRNAGKRVVAYMLTHDRASYLLACGADTIVMPPAAQFEVLGLRAEVEYLRDSLEKAGMEADVIAVSPYKAAGEQFSRTSMSPEQREQTERILEGQWQFLLHTIASRRKLSVETAQSAIDDAPLSAEQARARGLIDVVAYEDALPQVLQAGKRPPVVKDWDAARPLLLRQRRSRVRQRVAVVTVEGGIMTGRSRRLPVPLPLLGGQQAGSSTVTQALRQAEQDRRIAAVVLYVDSPGGSAFASDLIWREVERINRTKPVVVAMGNVAASGGYYIAAPAAEIVAQPLTVTGSIGVITIRLGLERLLERLGVHVTVLARGNHSALLGGTQPLTDAEREVVRQQIALVYRDFKQRVQAGRKIDDATLEPIAGGRVWLGQDAHRLKLIDTFGGLPEAVERAQQRAGIRVDRYAPLSVMRGGRAYLPPEPFPTTPAALQSLIQYLRESARTRVWAVLPFRIDDRG